jgi:hypothetical protein
VELPTHFAIYHREHDKALNDDHRFQIQLSGPDPESEIKDLFGNRVKLVKTIRIPKSYLEAIQRAAQVKVREKEARRKYVGHLGYLVSKDGKIFESSNCFPKTGLSDRDYGEPQFRGLGAYLEIVVTNILKTKYGATHVICDDFNISPARLKQLATAGLLIGEPVPIDEWMRGLGGKMRESFPKERKTK